MNVFVTGGTGFVGREILKQLAEKGHSARVLIRAGSETKLADHNKITVYPGDITDPASLSNALQGCDAVIHLVGIIREFADRGVTFERLHVDATQNILEAAATQGVRRYLHMSSNGTRANAQAKYHITKWQAEEKVRQSGLDWTIFRPSLIFGPKGEFVEMLADLIRKMPVVPVIGDGRYRMQPVSVGQVAESFVKALSMPETINKTYHLCGAEDYSYDEILDLTGAAIGKEKVPKAHQPLFMIRPMVKLMEHLPSFPITSEQLTMMLEGNCCDPSPWSEVFGIEPIAYAMGIDDCFE
ncbi:MAG: complex I NDUFA9 subunit family protein [Deltaproteobacteria bacterium]|jgi:NADH dehydrogenase|nr:complex I NDUFA9 subunit family protein [Deltaproteobacteria bacterium]